MVVVVVGEEEEEEGRGGSHSVSSCWRRLFCWAWLFCEPCGPGPFWEAAAPMAPWFRYGSLPTRFTVHWTSANT